MKYDLFLVDLDDTLLDFKESERLSFYSAMQSLGLGAGLEDLFKEYQVINTQLWKQFELAQTTKEHLKVERFRKMFEMHRIDIDPSLASTRYLDTLPETVVLIEYAVELCQELSQHGELGIITNGIQYVQSRRIQNSALAPFINFVSVSEECGHAKPDVRFFEYTAKKAKRFSKSKTIVLGDRLDADISGAHNFGVDSCWFNPKKLARAAHPAPTYEASHLAEARQKLLQ